MLSVQRHTGLYHVRIFFNHIEPRRKNTPAAGNPLVNLLPAERDADGGSSDPPGYVPEEYRVFFLKYRRSAQLRRFLCRQLSSLDLSADGDGIRLSDRRPDSHYQPGVSDDSVACGGKTVRPIFPVPALFRRNGNLCGGNFHLYLYREKFSDIFVSRRAGGYRYRLRSLFLAEYQRDYGLCG